MSTSPTPPLGTQPQRLAGQGLGGIFSPRSAGLRGGLPSLVPVDDVSDSKQAETTVPAPAKARPKKPELIAVEAPDSSSEPEPPAPKPKAKAHKTQQPPAAGEGSAEAGSRTPIVVYTSPATRKRWQAAVEAWRISQTDLVLRAISATHSRLGELLGGVSAPPEPSEDLFGSTPTRRKRQARPEGTVQMYIRPAPEARDIIDGLVLKHRAGSRSELVEVALETFLEENGF